MKPRNEAKLGAVFVFIIVLCVNGGIIWFMGWLGATDDFIIWFYMCGLAVDAALKFYAEVKI